MPGQFIARHSVRGMGELYLFQFILIPLGAVFLWRKREQKTLLLFISWLLLYPTGSMFTLDASAQATRSIIGVVPFQIISAFGLFYLFTLASRIRHKAFLPFTYFLAFPVLLGSSAYFGYLYFFQYTQYSADFWGWQYGARDITAYFVKHQNEYDDLVMAPEFNAPDIFFKFYSPNDCSKCRIGLPHELFLQDNTQLFAVTPQYLKEHSDIKFKTMKYIYYPNKNVAFQIGEVVQ